MKRASVEAIERDVRRAVARRSITWFVQTYFRDDEGAPFALQPFHDEMLTLAASDAVEDECLLFLEPAEGGKSTHIAKHYPLWLLSMANVALVPDPRIVLMGKTYDDAVSRVRAIKAELEGNEKLVADFGPFPGEKWTDAELTIANRRSRAKEASITAAGSETNIMGWRGTHAICDDIVTPANSGAQVKEETRTRLRENFNMGVRKLAVHVRIRWVNTVVDQRDLVHEIAAPLPQTHNPPPYRSRRGFKVVFREAYDERTGEILWPTKWTREWLDADRQNDPVSHLKRMQNRCLDPGLLNFPEVWFTGDPERGLPGCLDWQRCMGELPPAAHPWTRAAGFDPGPGTSASSKWSAWVEVAFDKSKPRAERELLITDLVRFRATLPEIERFVVDRTIAHNVSKTKVENNAAQQWILQLERVKAARRQGWRIEGHYTGKANKPDPEFGVPGMAERFKDGLVRFPYGDGPSRQMSDLLIEELTTWPQGLTSDLLMALWIATLAEAEAERRLGIQQMPVPRWIHRYSPRALDAMRHFGRMQPRTASAAAEQAQAQGVPVETALEIR